MIGLHDVRRRDRRGSIERWLYWTRLFFRLHSRSVLSCSARICMNLGLSPQTMAQYWLIVLQMFDKIV